MTAFEDTIASVKRKVAGAVEGLAGDLEALSHRIHDNPELCFKEEKAHWARSPIARAGMVAGAKALALTALDLLASPDKLAAAKEEFAR